MINIYLEIERLLQFGLQRGLIGRFDVLDARNRLLDLFQLDQPYAGDIPAEQLDSAAGILANMVEYAGAADILTADQSLEKSLFDTRIMGILMPRPSEVVDKFQAIRQKQSIRAATDWFYQLSIASNYIRMADIRRNISWLAETEYGELNMTINLSKPEKDPKQIALEKSRPQAGYPTCLLCPENVGYAGRLNFPARQTLRLIPVQINQEDWYMQYSPYVYYNEHCIVLSDRHEPMTITAETFSCLFDFVREYPHYFCGSNADLPIVGGSILSHNHFQGGRFTFPMHRAKAIRQYRHPDYPDLKISLLKWPLSVIRIAGGSPEQIVGLGAKILSAWQSYSDPAADILSGTRKDNTVIPHNTITPIARINPDGDYELDLVLRNNRTSEVYPDGIFHPHREIHHIKKENIGLIEVMGLAILPGRLQSEMQAIADILTGKQRLETISGPDHPLDKHLVWIKELVDRYGVSCTPDFADQVLRTGIGEKFKTGLEHAGVFKQNSDGLLAFARFMTAIGCNPGKE